MRFIFILALVAAAAAIPTPLQQNAADQELLKKQQDILCLFEQITERIPNQQFYNLGVTYDIVQNLVDYHNPNVVKYYAGLVQQGHVQPQGTPFSLSVSQLRKEVALLTRVLLGAKNYGVFIKTAAWARVNVNEIQFIKAMVSALLQHPDTQGLIPPALYEILPQHFIDSRVIHEAQNVMIVGMDNPLTEQTVVIPVNYTDNLPLGEHQLSYFTHDIGLAQYYAYISFAGYWMPEHIGSQGINVEHQKQQIGRGSIYLYLHQQLLAHYNLQRIANGLGPIEEVNFEHVKVPFQPHVTLLNGLQLTGRSEDVTLTHLNQQLVRNIQLLEKRIVNAIDSGFVVTPQQAFLSLYQPDGLNVLGALIEGTGRSVNPRYYGSYQAVARQLLGNAPEFSHIENYTPAALDIFETAVRDPVLYKLWRRIVGLIHRYQESLPAWQYNDLVVPGVTIEKVIIPNFVTYFDHQIVDLTNGIAQPVNKVERDNLKVRAQVPRLNHKPYEYQIHVNSEKPLANAVVRVYLGPKHDYDGSIIDINRHRHYFVELDQFVYDLVEGKNVIVRDSHHAPHLSQDYPSIHQIKVHIDSALRSQNPFYVTEPHQIFGFPARLSIPKGHHGGLPLQVLVVISAPEHNIQYGPVVPAEYQTYQRPLYHIVEDEQYQKIVEGQVPVGHLAAVDTIPHFHQYGIYGRDAENVKYYYGHYFYHKYGHQYPIPQAQYYQTPLVHHNVQYQQYQQQYHQHQQQHQQQHHHYIQPQQQHHHHQQYQHQTQPEIQQTPINTIYQQIPRGIYQGERTQRDAVWQHGQVYPYGVAGQVEGVQQPVGQTVVPEGQRGQYNVYRHNVDWLRKYYQSRPINEIIGGVVSLDSRPLGFPLDRPLAPSAFYVSNIKVADVVVFHEDYPTV